MVLSPTIKCRDVSYSLSGVGSLPVCRFKFTENLIVIPMVQTLHTSANILHVCIHKNVLTMFQQKLHLLVNNELNFSVIWKISMFTNATNKISHDWFSRCWWIYNLHSSVRVIGLPTHVCKAPWNREKFDPPGDHIYFDILFLIEKNCKSNTNAESYQL